VILWIIRLPSWFVVVGFGAGWLVGALTTVRLYQSLNRAS
jgi:hypothetical protein